MYPVNIYPAQFDTKNIVVFNLSLIEPYNTYSETMRDFDGEFTSEAGVHIAATRNELKILQEHCWAKFGGILTTTESLATESLTVYTISCANSPLPHRHNMYLSYGAIR